MSLPEELITEVLSVLPVKSILRFKCVCKPWECLISDPFFVEKQLHQSQNRNKHLALIVCRPFTRSREFYYDRDCSVVPFPLNALLLNNPSITIPVLPHHRLRYKRCFRVIGSINGLLCLFNSYKTREGEWDRNTWFRLWNPATKKISQKLGLITHPYSHSYYPNKDRSNYFRFAFGYDESTHTYKVVAFCPNQVKIFNFGDNVWKTIQRFPIIPLYHVIIPLYHVVMVRHEHQRINEGVYLSGTINWLAILNCEYFSSYDALEDVDIPKMDQFVIISLNLSTETYRQFLPPCGLVDVPYMLPTISVLRDRLCFSYHIDTTHFSIWMMMEFGVQESWTQFLNISYADLQIDCESRRYGFDYILHPLCLSEDDDTIILSNSHEEQAFLYNWRENRVEKTRITNSVLWMFSHTYMESLVSTGG